METVVISRIRILTFLLTYTYVISNIFFEDLLQYLVILSSIFYSFILYYFSSHNKINETLIISVLDEIFILIHLFTFKNFISKFLFLIYLPVIKEVLFRRDKEAFLLGFICNVIIILYSLQNTQFLSPTISFSLIPFSFLIPYLSLHYTKEKPGG
uniref:Sensor histidine kinase n=1 Tax=Dictyoglomus thermophilum TaxID=14 RepID=A0A7C3RK06_DICTH